MIGESQFSSFTIQNTNTTAIIECEKVQSANGGHLFGLDVYMHKEENVRHLRYSDRLLLLRQIISNLSDNSLDTKTQLGEYTLLALEHVHILSHTGGNLPSYLK